MFGTVQELFKTPEKSTEAVVEEKEDLYDSVVVVAKCTPKMNALFGRSSDIIIGYFGDLEFINKHMEFDKTFGTDPVILLTNPAMADTTTTVKQLLSL